MNGCQLGSRLMNDGVHTFLNGPENSQLMVLVLFLAGRKTLVIKRDGNGFPFVQSIDQIIELPKELRGTDLYQQGLLGFALINERVVNVLNIPEILQMHGHVQEQTMPLF